MLRTAARAVAGAIGLRPPGRLLDILDDDVFIVSYPKSGNTWIRFVVSNLLESGRRVDFTNINDVIPDIYKTTRFHVQGRPRPRVLKSHEYLDPRYPRVVYVVRDPRDVLASYYHYQIKIRLIPEDFPIERFAERFLAGRVDPWGSWREHAGGWLGARRGRDDFLLVRYEDLSARPKEELARIAGFLGLERDGDALARAVERSSADRMRELEQRQGMQWGPLKRSRPDRLFVRSAQAGGWRREVPAALAERVVAAWGDTMAELGYAGPSSDAAAPPTRRPCPAHGHAGAHGPGR